MYLGGKTHLFQCVALMCHPNIAKKEINTTSLRDKTDKEIESFSTWALMIYDLFLASFESFSICPLHYYGSCVCGSGQVGGFG